MKCNRIVERFLEREDNDSISLSMQLHLVVCHRCRREIFELRKLFRSLRDVTPFDMSVDLSDLIMYRIKESEINYGNTISSIKWLIVGFIILASIFLMNFSHSLLWLKLHFGRDLLIPLNIVMGLVISIYSAFIIGAHIDKLKTFMNSLYQKIH